MLTDAGFFASGRSYNLNLTPGVSRRDDGITVGLTASTDKLCNTVGRAGCRLYDGFFKIVIGCIVLGSFFGISVTAGFAGVNGLFIGGAGCGSGLRLVGAVCRFLLATNGADMRMRAVVVGSVITVRVTDCLVANALFEQVYGFEDNIADRAVNDLTLIVYTIGGDELGCLGVTVGITNLGCTAFLDCIADGAGDVNLCGLGAGCINRGLFLCPCVRARCGNLDSVADGFIAGQADLNLRACCVAGCLLCGNPYRIVYGQLHIVIRITVIAPIFCNAMCVGRTIGLLQIADPRSVFMCASGFLGVRMCMIRLFGIRKYGN